MGIFQLRKAPGNNGSRKEPTAVTENVGQTAAMRRALLAGSPLGVSENARAARRGSGVTRALQAAAAISSTPLGGAKN